MYAEGFRRNDLDDPKIVEARRIFETIHASGEKPYVPLQALAELHDVLVRKGRISKAEAAEKIADWRANGHIIDTTETIFELACGLAADHGMRIFDAIIIAAAAQAECDILLTEDLQDGFEWRGLTVRSPFAGAS